MELLCPECMGALAVRDGQSARCTVHGGEFRVLFVRAPRPVVPMENQTSDSNQPRPLATDLSPPPTVDSLLAAHPPVGMRCVQHPAVLATQQCQSCGAYMCATCDFALPGGMHLCPACATKPQTGLSAKRKHALIASFAIAVWCTVGMGMLLAGTFTGYVKTPGDRQVLGVLLSLTLLLPSIVGLALGLGSIDRRLANPQALWIATIWNGLILAAFLLLCVIGAAK